MSTFEFEPTPTEHSNGSSASTTAAAMDSIRVLHVDDDPSVVDLSESFLKKTHDGFTVESKTDPKEIVEQLRSGSLDVDCIVSDYRMPEMDGLELLEAVREHEPALPFILFTGKGSEEIAADAIAAGVTDYVQKGGPEAYSILANRIENVVENYRRQQELDRIHEQYHGLIENSSNIICIHDADGVIQYVSDSVERILGGASENFLGETLFELIHPDDRETVVERFSELTSREDATEMTVRYRCQDATDEWRWLEAAITDERSSSLDGFVVNARDVTEQVRQEQELKRQQGQLNALFEGTRELFTGDTREEIATTAVEAARDVLGLSINGIHLHDEDRDALVPTATTDRAKQVIGEAPSLGAGESAAWDVFESGEPRMYHDVRTAPGVYNSDTHIGSECILPIGEYGVFLAGSVEPNAFEDRTVSLAKILAANVEAALDRLDRETELRETSQRLQTVVDHTPDALFVLDDDQQIVEVNEQACASLGHEREELLGMHRSEIVHSEEEQEPSTESDSLAPLRENPETVLTRENKHVRKDGSTFSVRVKVTRIEESGDHRFLAIARDISGLKAQEQHLRRQNERLEEFAGIVSHDLQGPLATARTGVELASRSGDGVEDSLERVERAHDRMAALIDELLALARNGQVIDEENVAPVELSDVAARGWDLISTSGAELRVDNADTIVADHSRLQQLLENLFRNAVDHGEDSVVVRVGMLPDGFYVEDDGPGIPETDRDEVFAHGYTTRDDGTGFGLGIVRDVVDAHGWDVVITDSADGGARFEITGARTRDWSS